MSQLTIKTRIKPLGDSALIVQLGEGICPEIHENVSNLTRLLEKHPFDGFVEAVPAYNSLTIYYNPHRVYLSHTNQALTPFQQVCTYIEKLSPLIGDKQLSKNRIVELPVVYGGEFGPDLEYVAKSNDLSIEKVIQIHSKNEYLVYMIGFAPGFPFLGGMDERIATPRKETPRLAIPSGSVGIAGKQTGVYPLETPGGWQIIGRTPLDLFLPDMSPPTLLEAGDKIRFVPVSAKELKI
ncbi:5-oxoprolinase subunit PxpB [Sporosarcina sp. Marseille-Q4063]|uniref:5-oxoprolinase subunit PxpB n=1 Tax=Sporosarcina sp. Marseille-Q4063 TaxID=2810514 RepID=UPI001BAF5663|nr:5-oxoprolinase subunit PxpB [Sporosarcina sp. Marseille-Q4063]QUW24045.1 5-oxoprolinase subunit PxpB [Sporosarcina sp. Marseille-Q4063]